MKILTKKEFLSLSEDKQTCCVIYPNGDKKWYEEGELHREDGPAIEYISGEKHWFKDYKPHRLDGPAIEHDSGYKVWFKEGRLHREDGPAIEHANGDKVYYLDDVRYSYNEWYAIVNNLNKFI